MQLAGTSVLVTGGSGGLGAAAVRAFHAAGAAVVIADVADGPSAVLAKELGDRAVYVRTDVTDQASVAAAKGAVVSLTLAAARDLAPVGVRVNCIAPGTMRTPTMETVGPDALAKFEAAVPFPSRLGRPEEYGALAVHIASNDYLN